MAVSAAPPAATAPPDERRALRATAREFAGDVLSRVREVTDPLPTATGSCLPSSRRPAPRSPPWR